MQQTVSLVVVLLVCTLGASQAFFFGRDNAIARSNGREVDQTCLDKADDGDCEFYTCFESRLPCGRDWYILKHGHFYCNKINRMIDTFTEEAQEFLRDSQRCMMRALKDAYQEDSIECHDLEHQAIASISGCFVDNAFCSAIQGNYPEFLQIYEIDDLFSTGAGKVWREIGRLIAGCGNDMFSSLAVSAQQQFNNLGNTLDNAADSAQTHLSNFANNAEEALGDAAGEMSDALGDAAADLRSRLSDLWKKK